jgi:membrane peptidoglycan carboxypeptidase
MPKEVPLKLVKKKFLAVLLALAGVGVLSSLALGGFTAYLVYFGDVSELKKSTILARINEETTLFTLDEQTKIGSIFDDSHRSYVTIDQVPEHMIQAMVAAEDKNFFQHFGVDPTAIALAFGEGVQNGFRFRRGGSSITQQTVKNIMDHREHSFKRKFKELIRAFQLERMYSKQQILEFYLNQFHVTANGKGIGIAARYYFNKDVKELNLVEAAFIAGSVKAPNKYNPFVKYTREDKEEAWNNANWRKNYVLRRMYEQGWIKEDEFKTAFNERVPFNQGKFRTQEVALVSLIRGQLDKKEILEALDMESIAELNHAGLKVYTTIDQKLQDAAQLQMRRNLSRLEMILEDYKVEDKKLYRPLRDLDVNQFYYAKVDKVVKGKTPEVHLDFGLPKGVISSEALIRTAKILSIPTYRPYEEHLKEITDRIKVGDVVFVEVLEYDEEKHMAAVELKKRPEVNGGLIAVDEGEVRAVVSGFDSQGYNRAVFATRQPGSVFKSVVFFAAMQLGWTILDRIDNERRIFPFQGKFYLPRPDHSSPYEDVSILWTGVKSENLATVYLTAHLLDKLNFEEFKELLNSMSLMPLDGEAPRDFHYRVAKETGVQLDNNGVKEYMLNRAVEELKPDLIFSGRMELLREVSKIWWGRGYMTELQNIYRLDDGDVSDRERNLRLDLVRKNWERLSTLALDARQDWKILEAKVAASGPESIFTDAQTLGLVSRFRVLASGHRPALGYVKELPGEEFKPGPKGKLVNIDPPVGRPLNPLDAQAIWGGGGVSLPDVNLGGFLPLRYYDRIAQSMEDLYQSVISQKDQYSLYQYFNHHDFRIIVGLRYLSNLSRAMGVYSKLEPVMSFGLGTNDVSVAEVAKVYQTFANGKIYRFYKEGPDNQLNFIRRIEDREGNLLYEPKRQEFQLVDPCYAAQMSEILRKVVTHGTGRRARGELYVEYPVEGQPADKARRIGVPAYGKTGTTNDYTTAYFAGYVPFPVKPNEALEPMVHSHIIASYVGYDHNKTMRRGGFRISGAYGALPVWTDYAKAMIKETGYQKMLNPSEPALANIQVWPTRAHSCSSPVAVDLPQGLVMQGSGDGDSYEFTNFEKEGETFQNEFARSASVRSYVNLATVLSGGSRVPRRAFQPFLKQDGVQSGPKLIEGQPGKDNTAAREGNIPVLPVMEPVPIAKGEAPRGTAGATTAAGTNVSPAPAAAAPAAPSAPSGMAGDAPLALPMDKTSGAEKKVDPTKKIEEDAGLQDDELW